MSDKCKKKCGDCKKDSTVPSLKGLDRKEIRRVRSYVSDYMSFLRNSPITEYAVEEVVRIAEKNGFLQLPDEVGIQLAAEGYYIVNKTGTAVALFKPGKKPLSEGIRVIAPHIDSPCLELKQHPFKEDEMGVLLDTYYYGGIKEHQYFSRRVRVLGRVIKEDGSAVEIDLPGVIADLAPHMDRGEKSEEQLKAENLDVITGYKTKEALLRKLGVSEEDFAYSHVYCVPDSKPAVIGDYISGYCHDDKVCVYSGLQAIIEAQPEYASMVIAFDREEIGSTSLSGAKGTFFNDVLDKIIHFTEGKSLDEITEAYHRAILSKSRALSTDVEFGTSHLMMGKIDPQNQGKFGHGVIMVPHAYKGGNFVRTGFLNELRRAFNENSVVHQVVAFPSKVDAGGGGTIAIYLAQLGLDIIDLGIAVEGMHSPEEILHTGDLYQHIRAGRAFLEKV